MKEVVSVVGYVAAACTTSAFLPQVLHTLKTKHTESISLSMYIIFTIGVFLWLLYGFFHRDLAIISANAVTFVFAATVLYLKIKHSKSDAKKKRKHRR